MRAILASGDVLTFLSPAARDLLAEGRGTYSRYELDARQILSAGPHTVLLPWVGSRASATITAQLAAAGLEASNDGLTITVTKLDVDSTVAVLTELAEAGAADPVALASTVANKASQKYDQWLTDDLLAADYARRALDTETAHRAICTMLASA